MEISMLRKAQAKAIIQVSKSETILALHEGNVLEKAKVAGLLAVKKTHKLIPDCLLIPIEFTSVDFEIQELRVSIFVTVKTISQKEVETEAMHGASVAALTICSKLLSVDREIAISEVALIGSLANEIGNSNFSTVGIRTAVVVCSNAIYQGAKADTAGKEVLKKLRALEIPISSYEIIPDDLLLIRQKAQALSQSSNLVIFTGGTGFLKSDQTPEALKPILDKRIPGIEEAIRSFGQKITPFAMFSRSVAGMIGDSLILALPGSTNGAKESMDAIFPQALQVLKNSD